MDCDYHISNKRKTPSCDKIKERKKKINLQKKRKIQMGKISGFSDGNNKTGTNGGCFDSVRIWNMPYYLTCPGASELCKKICYCAEYMSDGRSDANYLMFLENRLKLEEEIVNYLNIEIKGKLCAIRLHSEGDFFSKEYIAFWYKIMKKFPQVYFWAYTKSWRVKNLKSYLDKLEELPNFNLYYSWDKSMDDMTNHKQAILVKDYAEIKKYNNAIVCPEQYNFVQCCADCGICLHNKNKDIIFLMH